MSSNFEKLVTLFQEATHRIVIVCPFIKVRVLQTLLNVTAQKVDVYTRWLPKDVAAGVSDLAVLDVLAKHDAGNVFLLRELHAKVFSSGETALVGSVNLTMPGTGLGGTSNVELLIKVPSDTRDIVDLLELVRRRSTRASKAIQESIANAAALMSLGEERFRESAEDEDSRGYWLPRCTEPRRLFQVYQGNTRLLDSTVEDALVDLGKLQSPEGLDREEFIAHVRAVVLQSAVFNVVERALSDGVEDPVGVLGDEFNIPREELAPTWRVLQSWLLYFFKERFSMTAPTSAMQLQIRRRSMDTL